MRPSGESSARGLKPVPNEPRQTSIAIAHRRAASRAELGAALRNVILPGLIGGIVFALYTMFSSLQWVNHAVRSWDLGIFTQLAARYAELSTPIVTIKGDGFNLLGDHFHPILVLLGPIYAAAPHAFTLLVLQNALFAIAAAVLVPMASRIVGPILGPLLALGFGLSWGLAYAVEAQFHEIAVGVPLLTIALVSYLNRRWLPAVVFAAALVFVKEDLGLTVTIFGLILALRDRERLGWWLAAWGFGWFVLATLVIVPLLSPVGGWTYGSNINLVALITDPASTFSPAKWHTAGLLLVTMAGIGLRSPLALLLLPTLAWRMLSSNPSYWGPEWHYSAMLMPIAIASLLDGIRLGHQSGRAWLRSLAGHAATISTTAALVILPLLPLGQLLRAGDAENPRNEAAEEILNEIPDGVDVETDIGLMSYLADRTDVYWTGNENPTPEYLLIDRQAGGTPTEWGGVLEVAHRLHPQADFLLVEEVAGYELARRVD